MNEMNCIINIYNTALLLIMAMKTLLHLGILKLYTSVGLFKIAENTQVTHCLLSRNSTNCIWRNSLNEMF